MYERFFSLVQRPFAAAPSPERYVPTSSLEHARQTLIRSIERAEGPGLLVGPAGTGKSLVCHLLAQHFSDRFSVALLNSARLSTRRALLQNVLFELKLPYRDMDEAELRLSLVDHLQPRDGTGEGLLLLVDEAHLLPLRLLEEIRLLTNLVRDGASCVRLVLAGGMALEERLASPKLESFQQRLAARCYLQPMGRDETIYYVQQQIRRTGGSPEQLFTSDALRAIHTATDGIPRLVNQLCDHALMLAALGGHRQLGPAGIEEAWADLQQLPAPWHEPTRAADGAASGVVEFGALADDSPVAVTSRSVEGDVAVARLATIQGDLTAIDGDESQRRASLADQDDDFFPGDESGTEVELVFHNAHDPFGSGWEDEEIVIDRYASLEEASLRRVASGPEGRSLGDALNAASGSPTLQLAEASLGSDAFDLDDPLLPREVDQPRPRRTAVPLRQIAADDRDMIVVQEDETPASNNPLVAAPRNQNYRQLFSSLRKNR